MDLILKLIAIFFIWGIIEYLYSVINYNLHHDEHKYLLKTNFIVMLEFFVVDIPKYFFELIKNIISIIFSIKYFFQILLSKLSENNYKKIFEKILGSSIKNFYKKYIQNYYYEAKSQINIRQQVQIFYSCIFEYLQTDNSIYRNRASNVMISFFIFLLQFGISFATTLAGSKLMLGSISSIAPWFFTIVVQGLIVILSYSAFQKNRKRRKYIFALVVSVIISVYFSYTGIIVAQDSPIDFYRSTYETYEQTFDMYTDALQNQLLSEKDAIQRIKELSAQLNNNYNVLLKEIENAQIERKNLQESIRKYIDSRNGMMIDEKGNRIPTTRQGSAEGEEIAQQNLNEVNSKLATLEAAKSAYDDLFNGKINFKDEEIKTYIDNLNNDADNNKSNISNFPNIIKIFNNLSSNMKITSIDSINENDFNEIKIANKLYNEISDIQIEKSSDIFAENKTSVKKEKSNSFINAIVSILDADLSNELNNVSSIRNIIQSNTETSYKKINAISANVVNKDNNIDLLANKLKESKQDIQKLSNVYSYSIEYLIDDEKNILDIILILLFALLVDVGSAALGYVKQKTTTSFIYVKTSKDYYDEYSDIFEILFMSLMRNFECNIVKGIYKENSYDDFKLQCIKYAKNANEVINSFLNQFELSEATWSIGYNLKCDLKTIKNPKNGEADFIPLLSILLKTGMAKIITYQQYEILLENLYYKKNANARESNNINHNDSQIDILNSQNYYVLLRSRGENFLRENMPLSFENKIEEKESEKNGK